MILKDKKKIAVLVLFTILIVSNIAILMNYNKNTHPINSIKREFFKEGMGFLDIEKAKKNLVDNNIIKPLTKQVYLKLLKNAPKYPGRELSYNSISPTLLNTPSSVDNTLYLPPVGNQGHQGSCVGWASTYYTYTYMQYWYRNYTHPTQEDALSPAFTYNFINNGTDSGSYFIDASSVISELGAVIWSSMPYNQDDYTTWPNEQQYLEAMHYRAGTWYSLNIGWGYDENFQELKNLLALGYVAMIGILVYDDFYTISTTDNNIYAENETHNTFEGGHAQTIIGYNDNITTPDGNGAFRIINSWGTNWGDNGYYWLTYMAARGNMLSQKWVYVYVPKKNPASYNPEVISFLKIQHDKRGEIIGGLYDSSTGQITVPGGFSLGTKVDNIIVWSNRFFNFNIGYYSSTSDLQNYQAHPFPNSSIALDLTDSMKYLSKYANNWEEPFYINLKDKVNDGDVGKLESFGIEINTTYLSEYISNKTLPEEIPENGNSLIAQVNVPIVNYGSKTPENNTTVTKNMVAIDLGSLVNISSATLNWNGTNYTMAKINTHYFVYNISGLTSGEYKYRIYVKFENGNKTALPYRFIEVKLLPDLIVTSVSVSPTTVNEGNSVIIYANVKNIGNASANNIEVGFYYDTKSESTYIGNASIDSLNIGENKSVEISWNTNNIVGYHKIIAYADPNNTIEEENETNNFAITNITINGYGVNLSVDSSSKTVPPGGYVNYTIIVRNIGTIQDTFDLSTSLPTNGWSASLSTTKVTLNASENTSVILTIHAPSSATNGAKENITVTATSESEPNKSDNISTTTIVSIIYITSIHIYSHLDAVINYTTSQNVKSYIKYGIGPNHLDLKTSEESNANIYHDIAIENLTPEVKYFFKIYMTDGTQEVWSKLYNFTLSGFNDFEFADNPKSLYNWKLYAWNSSTDASCPSIWQWGEPTAGPSEAHSGNDVIGTVLNGYYGVDDHIDALITPWIDLKNASWVTLSFYAWYDLENTYDGVLIAYQNDSSSSWYVLDVNNNASQYDAEISTSYESAIGGYYAFTGESNSWIKKTFNTSTINDPTLNRYILGHKVRFIFYFASDNSVHNHYGFYLDDIQIKAGIPVYHIYGYVNDSGGDPVENATVWVNDTTLGISYKTTTNQTGRYDIYTYNGINGDNITVEVINGFMLGTNNGTLGSTTQNEVEINIILQAVPELNMIGLLILIFGVLIIWRRKN